MQPGRRAVVVGMGFIGSEVAASLRHEGVDVVAIDPAKTPLFRVLGEDVGQTLADLHRSYGVRTIFEDTVAAFEGTGRVDCVVTRAGQRIPCDFVVLGIGVEPVVDLLEGCSIGVDNGVVVDQYCHTSVSGIYAAGDVANHYHPVFERHIRVEHWQNAMKQGVNAARNMRGERVPYELVVRGRLDAGSYAAFYMNGGRIAAVVSMNNAKDVRRAMPLIKSRRPVDPAQLLDENVDLRSLHASP
jgi:3-phenylpropionate/trans-cinnamate dioxygenase ferredoxin reductase subunit